MARIPLTDKPVVEDKQPASKIGSPARISTEEIEVPFKDYQKEHGKPYIVDHFKLGDTWEDPVGGFPSEINAINNYVNQKIETGEIANSITAVKDLIKSMEKFNNLNKEERSLVKLEVLAHYVEFLQKNETTKANLRRYNGTV